MRHSPPSRFSIAEYWHRTEPDWIESLDLPCCFACKYDWLRHPVGEHQAKAAWNRSRLDRAHIRAESCGGSFEVSNFLLLCSRCHRESPMLSKPDAMLQWAKSREYWPAFAIRRVTEELKLLDATILDAPINTAALVSLARHMHLARHPRLPEGDPAFAGWAAVIKEYCELNRIGFRWEPNS